MSDQQGKALFPLGQVVATAYWMIGRPGRSRGSLLQLVLSQAEVSVVASPICSFLQFAVVFPAVPHRPTNTNYNLRETKSCHQELNSATIHHLRLIMVQ